MIIWYCRVDTSILGRIFANCLNDRCLSEVSMYFFNLDSAITNTIISKESRFRLDVNRDVIYIQRKQQGTENGVLRDTRHN